MSELYFSAKPGCWERHLQRKYQYPALFPEAEHLSQTAVNAAQRQDEGERIAFTQDFNELLEKVIHLKAQEDSEVILELKDRIDRLYEHCSGLGGDYMAEKAGLKKLNGLIMNAIRSTATLDEQAMAELDKESQARDTHFHLLEYPLIAHLLRPDTPVTQEEIVPTLLCEEEGALRAAMSIFDAEHQQLLRDMAQQFIAERAVEGADMKLAKIRLAMMEQASG